MYDSLESHNTLTRAIRTFRLPALRHASAEMLLIYLIKAETQ